MSQLPPPPGSDPSGVPGSGPAPTPYSPGTPYNAGPYETNGMAIAAMVCSIVGLIICTPLGLVGIILGVVANNQIKATGGVQPGRGMAMAGIIIGAITLVLGTIVFFVVLSVDSSSSTY